MPDSQPSSLFAYDRFWALMGVASVVLAVMAWLTDTSPRPLAHGASQQIFTTGALTIIGKAVSYFLVAGLLTWIVRMGYRAYRLDRRRYTLRKVFFMIWLLVVAIDVIWPLL